MESRVIYNQYTIGEYGHFHDMKTHEMIEGYIRDIFEVDGSVYLLIATGYTQGSVRFNTIRAIKVA